ncbi:MAG: hypothetical protein AAF541_10590 [Pseudomonadota bacterium]
MIAKRNSKPLKHDFRLGVLGLCWALILGACGGGSSSSSSANQTLTGVFIDSPVAGVSYNTASRSGVTDNNGTFEYEAGEQVTFNLGSVELGSVPGANEVTLFDLAGMTEIPTDYASFSEAMWITEENNVGPLNRVTNLAMLLQSLDADANPENGIEIPSGIDGFMDSTINLDENYWEFQIGGNGRDARGLPGLLRAANNAQLLSPRPVTHPAKALEHVFEQAGVEVVLWGNTTSTIDNNADGAIDWLRTLTYGPTGDVDRDTYDSDGDGNLDLIYDYTYNDNYQTLSYTRDSNGDGTVDQTTEFVYDEFGARTLRQDTNASGTPTSREVLEYDIDGNLVRRTTGVDTTSVEIWIVDEDGMRSTADYDTDGDGVVDRRITLTYEGRPRGDRWLRADIDDDMDGTIDGVRIRSFNARGQMLTNERDDNLDGTLDYTEYFTYNEQGFQTSYQRDIGGNGVDYARTSSRRTDGQVSEDQYDSDGDGVYESGNRYTYDEEGKRTRLESYRDAGATIVYVYTYTYNSDGKQQTRSYDRNGDGTINDMYEYFYNENGQLERWTRDRNNDSTIDYVATHEGWVNIGLASYF